jgi:uncharacterized protein (DUF2344 family)
MTIISDDEKLKRAVKWISDKLNENENLSKKTIINEACLRFNLDPKQSMFLFNFYKEE